MALVLAEGYRFWTADRLAVKMMQVLTLLPCWVPLEELLVESRPAGAGA